jgi:hypothetical protein
MKSVSVFSDQSGEWRWPYDPRPTATSKDLFQDPRDFTDFTLGLWFRKVDDPVNGAPG